MGPERIHVDTRLVDTGWWCVGRPLRASTHLRYRRRLVRCGIAVVRPGPQRDHAGRRAHAAGRRRRVADAGQSGHHSGIVPSRRPRSSDRRLVGPGRGHHSNRSVRRRLPGRCCIVAVDLPAEPAVVCGGPVDHRPPRARVQVATYRQPARLARRIAGRHRSCGHHVGSHRTVMADRHRGHRRAGRVRGGRSPSAGANAAAGDLQVASVQRHQPDDPVRLRRSGDGVLHAGSGAATRTRILTGRGRRSDVSFDSDHAGLLGARRRVGAEDRPALADDHRTVGHRVRAGPDDQDRTRPFVHRSRAAGRTDLRRRAGADGCTTHGDRAGRRRCRTLGRCVGGEQRGRPCRRPAGRCLGATGCRLRSGC